jgi:hypothetical protein
MTIVRSRDTRWVVGAIAVYAAAGAIALSLDPPAKGWAVLACAAGGCAGLVVLARILRRDLWLAAAWFSIMVSVFQVLPDWFLVEGPGTLEFPAIGGPFIGDALPLAMAGLWAIPLFAVIVLAGGSAVRGALWALAIFGATELAAPTLGIWQPSTGLASFFDAAVYVLPAEAALGAAVVYAFEQARHSGAGARIAASLAVSVFYTGALAVSWLLIEGRGGAT